MVERLHCDRCDDWKTVAPQPNTHALVEGSRLDMAEGKYLREMHFCQGCWDGFQKWLKPRSAGTEEGK